LAFYILTLGAEFIGKWWPVSEVVVISVKSYHNSPPTPRNKIKLEISRLVNWANQIGSNNDMQYGVAIHVNPLGEGIFPRLKLNQEKLEAILDKN
jgi:hypothetical protein